MSKAGTTIGNIKILDLLTSTYHCLEVIDKYDKAKEMAISSILYAMGEFAKENDLLFVTTDRSYENLAISPERLNEAERDAITNSIGANGIDLSDDNEVIKYIEHLVVDSFWDILSRNTSIESRENLELLIAQHLRFLKERHNEFYGIVVMTNGFENNCYVATLFDQYGDIALGHLNDGVLVGSGEAA